MQQSAEVRFGRSRLVQRDDADTDEPHTRNALRTSRVGSTVGVRLRLQTQQGGLDL
jgi:hypothetical protein